jgi:hypothetical protein
VIPENPEMKQLTGASSLDMQSGRKISFWISITHLPFIFLAGIGTYFITTELDGFKQDFNTGKAILSVFVFNIDSCNF